MPDDTELRDVLGEELAERGGADVERRLRSGTRLRIDAYALEGLLKQRAARKAATRIAEALRAVSR